MRIEIAIHDADGNPRSWDAITQDLMEKVIVAGVALYGNKSAACQAFEIGRTTQYRRLKNGTRKVAKIEAKKPAIVATTKPPAEVRTIPPPKIVSDLGFLEARERYDPAWPPYKDDELRKLYDMRLAPAIIAEKIGRSVVSVERRLAKLGLRPSAYKLERENAL